MLRPSSRTGTSSTASNFSGAASAGYHPPLPPKPRSRPSSQHLDQADGESRGSVERETISGRGVGSDPLAASGSSNLQPSIAQTKGQSWPQQGCNVREEELVRELVYVFQGIQGSIITLDSTTGKFSLGRQLKMPDHQRAVVIKLCEVGRLYGEVREFTEKRAGETSFGLVGHSFVTALREELTEYYRLLAGLEASLREGSLTLLQMSVWTREPLARLKLLVLLLRSVGNARGVAHLAANVGLDAGTIGEVETAGPSPQISWKCSRWSSRLCSVQSPRRPGRSCTSPVRRVSPLGLL